MKFILLMNIKVLTILFFSLLNRSEHEIHPANEYQSINNLFFLLLNRSEHEIYPANEYQSTNNFFFPAEQI